jgi:hypothetical protein
VKGLLCVLQAAFDKNLSEDRQTSACLSAASRLK